jgi:hypothetical protein
MPLKTYTGANCLAYLLVFLALGATGCGKSHSFFDWKYTELKRVKSPDSQFEAVLVDGDAGATTSTVYKIYVVGTGTKLELDPQKDSSVFAADHLKGFDIRWKEPKLLEIHYEEARILSFRNFWFGRDSQNARFVVELQLRPATTNYALPLEDRR